MKRGSDVSHPIPTSTETVGLLSRRSFVSSSILFAENFLRLGVVAAVSFWIAHALGPAQFGVLNYASALVAVFWSLGLLGLDTPVIARLTRGDEPAVTLGSAVALRVAVGLACTALACGAVVLMRPGDQLSIVLVAIVALSIPISAPLTLDCWFKSRNEAVRPAVARIVATLLTSAAKVGCIVLGFGVVALAWTVTLEALFGALALIVAYLRCTGQHPPTSLSLSKSRMISLLKESWPYALSTVAIVAYMKIDLIILGMLSSDYETGIYGLCQKMSEVLYILPVVVVEVLYPQLLRQHHGQVAGTQAAAQSFFDLSVAVAMLSTVLAIAAVTWLVPALLGGPYLRSVDLFIVHSWSCVGLALAHARYKFMAATGLQAMAPVVTLMGLVLAILLNLALIPRFGAMGAAVAIVISYFTSGYLVSFLFVALRPAARMQTLALWPWVRLYRELRTA